MKRFIAVAMLASAFAIAGVAISVDARWSARTNCSDEIAACAADHEFEFPSATS